MKTAVSIPNDVFEGAERLARRSGKSRSQLYSDSLKEYVARHAPDQITEALDCIYAELKDTREGFVRSAAAHTLRKIEW